MGLERGLLRLRLRLSLLSTPTAMFLPTPTVPTGLQPMLEFTDQLIPCGDESIPNQMACTQLLTRTRTLKIIIINNIHQNTLCKTKSCLVSHLVDSSLQ